MNRNPYFNEDLRVKRTHKLILDALVDLTVQKGFSALTVSDIAKYAGINRATFYRHYQDKFDLLDKYAETVDSLVDVPPEPGRRKPNNGNPDRIVQGLVKLFEHMQANSKFYRAMLGRNGDPAYADKIRHYIQIRAQRSLPARLQKDETSVSLYLSYTSSAAVGALLWWLEHDMPYSPQEMAIIAYQLGDTNVIPLLRQTPSQRRIKGTKKQQSNRN